MPRHDGIRRSSEALLKVAQLRSVGQGLRGGCAGSNALNDHQACGQCIPPHVSSRLKERGYRLRRSTDRSKSSLDPKRVHRNSLTGARCHRHTFVALLHSMTAPHSSAWVGDSLPHRFQTGSTRHKWLGRLGNQRSHNSIAHRYCSPETAGSPLLAPSVTHRNRLASEPLPQERVHLRTISVPFALYPPVEFLQLLLSHGRDRGLEL